MKKSRSTTAIIYCRVSTHGQVEEGCSLQAQRARAEAWCLGQGLQVGAVHVDEGISGGTMARPGLQSALAEACRLRGVLVTYSLSRLSRSVRDAIDIAERLARAGAALVSLSESLDASSASGRLYFNMMASVGAFERDVISERTRAALAHKRDKGERVSGAPPLGYRFQDGQVVEDQAEQEAIERLKAWREAGSTFRELVARANREALPCRGRGWRLATVHAVLNR